MSDADDEADARVRDAIQARLVQEEIEAAAEQLHRNTRTLGELLLDWSDAGHQVRVDVGPRSWTGYVLSAPDFDGASLVALRTSDGRVEIDLASVSAATLLGPGQVGPSEVDDWMPASLVARLRWCTTQDPPVVVEVGDRDVVAVGVVVAVAATHVEVQQGSTSVALRPSYVILR